MLFQSTRRQWYRGGVSAALHHEFAVPVPEADWLCRTGKDINRSLDVGMPDEFFNRAHALGMSYADAAHLLIVTVLTNNNAIGPEIAKHYANKRYIAAKALMAVPGNFRPISLITERITALDLLRDGIDIVNPAQEPVT